MRDQRLGVFMTVIKARMFDLVKQAGEDGIRSTEIYERLYPDGRKRPALSTVKSHLWQLNDLLCGTDWIIVGGQYDYGAIPGKRGRGPAVYVLKRKREAAHRISSLRPPGKRAPAPPRSPRAEPDRAAVQKPVRLSLLAAD